MRRFARGADIVAQPDLLYFLAFVVRDLQSVELEMLRRASLSVRDRVVEALLRKGDLRVRKDGDALQLGPA